MQSASPEVLGGRQGLGVVTGAWDHFYIIHTTVQVTLPNTGKPKKDLNHLSSIRKWYHINLIAS